MTVDNLPIQVIVHCDAEGNLHPLRFCYETQNKTIQTIHVEQVVDTRQVEFPGLEAILYLCKGKEKDGARLYELKYMITAHKWLLFRRIY